MIASRVVRSTGQHNKRSLPIELTTTSCRYTTVRSQTPPTIPTLREACLVGDAEPNTPCYGVARAQQLPTTPPTIPTLREVCLVGDAVPTTPPTTHVRSPLHRPVVASPANDLYAQGWIYFQNALSAYYIRDGIKLELIKEGPVWVIPPETHIPALAAGTMHEDAAKVATYQAAAIIEPGRVTDRTAAKHGTLDTSE